MIDQGSCSNLQVDVDEVRDVAQRCGVTAMPTFQIYVKGQKVEQIVGANVPELKAALEKYKGQASFAGTGRTLGGKVQTAILPPGEHSV